LCHTLSDSYAAYVIRMRFCLHIITPLRTVQRQDSAPIRVYRDVWALYKSSSRASSSSTSSSSSMPYNSAYIAICIISRPLSRG